eukprot:TRINITY_DN74555_c0_g1_i1.p2 TRINITY_DN74555_c0_g1~~TRINITY_DN74555_c0_g1_i1.p2  ORF type:complete len:145 (+),score=10.22 TRINITY_DN74555_c0_g1_i1:56-436(+)
MAAPNQHCQKHAILEIPSSPRASRIVLTARGREAGSHCRRTANRPGQTGGDPFRGEARRTGQAFSNLLGTAHCSVTNASGDDLARIAGTTLSATFNHICGRLAGNAFQVTEETRTLCGPVCCTCLL